MWHCYSYGTTQGLVQTSQTPCARHSTNIHFPSLRSSDPGAQPWAHPSNHQHLVARLKSTQLMNGVKSVITHVLNYLQNWGLSASISALGLKILVLTQRASLCTQSYEEQHGLA